MIYSKYTLAFIGLLSINAFAKKLTPEEALGTKYTPRSSWSTERNYKNLDVSYDGSKNLISLHHTVTGSLLDKGNGIPEDKELILLKSIERDHIQVKKWADIGYHYIISPSGRIFECRRLDVQGAHTFKLNVKNVGLAFLGCYDQESCLAEGYKVNQVSEEMIDSAARLAAYVSMTENFILSANNLVPRSAYEREILGSSRIPGSPGNRIIDHIDSILAKAEAYREFFLRLENEVEL